ncbi:hypothetical protein [Herbiconiux sp. L3-i23]|uniref:hypothetical protein n=1 Tax=Herbiconiux sp. L3-i23 TaxID=2905871 RepID=UPI00206ED0CA|nr:hypothetical protein [Herbiconiux sp. L3-i23]BDI22042.1 hypothetical protein L3i23_08180 [Herbiconiux sp. L3-i23]
MAGIGATIVAVVLAIGATLSAGTGTGNGMVGDVPPSTTSASASASESLYSRPSAVALRLADPDDFSPGLLISDQRFYDDLAMDVAGVQSFLEQETCRPEEGVDCLADYRESTPDVPAVGSGHCDAYTGDEWESAAVIIVGVARACGINPQVLLVLMQKEQSLVSRPSPSGYERAMGYACPDTADCDTEYFGFFNQVYNAAWQFRQYTLFPTDRAYTVGTVDVGFNPRGECGAAPVEIENQATANLYLYTPYQPNEAAVAELYGEGDDCSSYGNRNFWRIFTDWFGDPTAERFPEWLGQCVTLDAGRPCLDSFWVAGPER